MTIGPTALFETTAASPVPYVAAERPESLFYACDLYSGQILTELPLGGMGPIRRRIAVEESATFTLAPADRACPPDWAVLTQPGRVMIVQTLDDAPVAAWALTGRVRGPVTATLTGVTFEHLLTRTNVPDVDHAGDEALGLAEAAQPLAAGFGFTIEATATGRDGDLFLSAEEDRTIRDVLTSAMEADGGPEWRVVVRWVDAGTRQAFEKVLQIGPRIGVDRKDAIFDRDSDGGGCITTYEAHDSYAPGDGATVLAAVSEGSGESRPMSEALVSPLVAAGWPRWEERVTFSGLEAASIDDEDAALARRARAALARREAGTTTFTVTGDETAPRPGVDFSEGDTVYLQIDPHPADPVGTGGQRVGVRVLGWDYDLHSGQVTPLLWSPPQDGA